MPPSIWGFEREDLQEHYPAAGDSRISERIPPGLQSSLADFGNPMILAGNYTILATRLT